jgi:PadR family transcriptional regulator PadR
MEREPDETLAAAQELSEPRMTLPTQLVLGVLLSDPDGQHYGLAISKQVGRQTGSIYPILARLERAGWVTSQREDIDPAAEGRRPRRYYKLTELGRQRASVELAETVRRITPQWPGWRPAPGTAGAEG